MSNDEPVGGPLPHVTGMSSRTGAELSQGVLLPEGLALHPRLLVSAAAVVADRDDAASGDWFDVVPVAGGRLGLVVGDVAGRGVRALPAVSQLRADSWVPRGDLITRVMGGVIMPYPFEGRHYMKWVALVVAAGVA